MGERRRWWILAIWSSRFLFLFSTLQSRTHPEPTLHFPGFQSRAFNLDYEPVLSSCPCLWQCITLWVYPTCLKLRVALHPSCPQRPDYPARLPKKLSPEHLSPAMLHVHSLLLTASFLSAVPQRLSCCAACCFRDFTSCPEQTGLSK